MKILTFNYTKDNGKQSDRVLAVLVKPNTMYEGIDISELDMEAQGAFAEEFNRIEETFLASLEAIKASFDVKHNYRRFDTQKMQAVVAEVI
jgi:hypothetical protein